MKNSKVEQKSKSSNHHPSTEEAEISFSNKSLIDPTFKTSVNLSSNNNNNNQINANHHTTKTFEDEQETSI